MEETRFKVTAKREGRSRTLPEGVYAKEAENLTITFNEGDEIDRTDLSLFSKVCMALHSTHIHNLITLDFRKVKRVDPLFQKKLKEVLERKKVRFEILEPEEQGREK